MIGADAIIKCLEAEGVSTVFGYPGVAICPFFNSILDSDIKTVLIRTEQNAAHAASGVARMTGRPGVCAVTSGPGATNVITGIATAFADSIPMICITGQVNSELLGSDVFQEADITGAVESFVKYSYLVKNVNDIPRVFKEAFYIANTGRKECNDQKFPLSGRSESTYLQAYRQRTCRADQEGYQRAGAGETSHYLCRRRSLAQ